MGPLIGLQEAKIGPDKDIPHVSAPMIVKYTPICSCADCYEVRGK